MQSGVSKSGSPAAKAQIFSPWAFSSAALLEMAKVAEGGIAVTMGFNAFISILSHLMARRRTTASRKPDHDTKKRPAAFHGLSTGHSA